ncbi:MAG: LysR family transcriptional regulator [Gammaproteobacteria bacterium]|nr:LysR family transcriptional regulator [Gammaproteobacteria bacterium]
MLPDIKIAHLRTFITVAECGNFRRAANILCRSQPAVSLAIKQLERLLGAELFDKQKQGQLTAFGNNFLPQATHLYQQYQNTLTSALQIAQAKTGTVRLGVLPSVAKHFLSHIMRCFMQQYPLVELQVQDDNGDNLRSKLLAGQIDLAVSSIWQHEPDIEHRDICRDTVGLVGVKEHPCMQTESIDWQQIAQHRLIRNGTTPLINNTAAHAFINAPMHIANMASLEAVLSAGAGITTLPWLAFPQNNTHLAFRVLQQGQIQRRIALLQLRQAHQLPATQALEKVILTHFASAAKNLQNAYLTIGPAEG